MRADEPTLDAPPRPEAPGTPRHGRLLREGAWVAGGQVATGLGRLAGIRMVTSVVSPAIYGEISLLLGLTNLGMSLFCQPFMQAALRFYPDADRDGTVGTLRRILRKLLVSSTLLVVVSVLVGGALWIPLSGAAQSWWAFVAVSLAMVPDVVRSFETSLLNAARRQAEFSLWSAADAWSRPVAMIAFALGFSPTPAAVLFGSASGGLLVNLGFRGRRVRPARAERPGGADAARADQVRTDILRYAGPLIPMAILSWVMNLGGRYFVGALAGVEAVGLYAAAYGLASQPFLVFSAMLVATLRPRLFEAVSRSDAARERKTVLIWLGGAAAGALVGAVLLAALSPWIVRVVLGPDFRTAAPLVGWIAAGYGFLCVQHLFETLLFAQQRTWRLLVLYGASAVLSSVFYVLLIPPLGTLGAALATCASFAASCGISFFLSGAPAVLLGAHPQAP